MSAGTVLASTVDPSVLELARREQAAIERRRKLYNLTSFGFALPAIWLLATGWQLSLGVASVSLAAQLATWGGMALMCGAAAYYSLYRGRHPAWGVLSLVSLLILALFPDRNARRLDELDAQLTGTHGMRVYRGRLSTALVLPFFFIAAPAGFVLAIISLFESHRRNLPLIKPIVATLWSGFVTAVLVNSLVQAVPTANFSNRAKGRFAQVELLAGWELLQTGATDGVTDITVGQPSKDLYLTVGGVSKQAATAGHLQAFADSCLKSMTQSGGRFDPISPPVVRMVDGQRRLQYEVRGTRDGSIDVVWINSYFETSDRFWGVSAWTTPAQFDASSEELQRAVDLVSPLSR